MIPMHSWRLWVLEFQNSRSQSNWSRHDYYRVLCIGV